MLAQILSSQVRAEIFQLLFNDEGASIYLRDLQRKSGFSIGSIQKEIANLKKMDLVTSKKDGNRLYYKANVEHPLYKEICRLVEKTSGIKMQLKSELSEVKEIDCAFIFGSYARGEEKSHSDIDLIVIGSLGLRTLLPLFKKVMERAGREINPHVYSLKSWQEKLKKKDHFIKSVIDGEKIFLVGDISVIR